MPVRSWLMELTHVTARAAAHFPMAPPPPLPPTPLRVMVARPAQPTQVTQVPITLTQHDTAAAPCDTTHPMWRHRGVARHGRSPPPLHSPPPPWLGKLLWGPLQVWLGLPMHANDTSHAPCSPFRLIVSREK